MSSMVVGMTVVAFGTSAPELGVNVAAAWKEHTSLTFGNVIGSNIANIGLILGLTAVIRPLQVRPSVVKREIPLMLAATAVTILLAGGWIHRGAPNTIDALDGFLLLSGFVLFLALTLGRAVRPRQGRPPDPLPAEAPEPATTASAWRDASRTLLGLGGVLAGSHFTVQGATEIAASLGLSETVVGLTIVAIGTSLPELTTSLYATFKGHADLCIGSIVGSNVFNLLFILGISSSIHSVAVGLRGRADLLALASFSLILLPIAATRHRITKSEGSLLVVGYSAYLLWRSAS
jgi:cation:H+ antiporter